VNIYLKFVQSCPDLGSEYLAHIADSAKSFPNLDGEYLSHIPDSPQSYPDLYSKYLAHIPDSAQSCPDLDSKYLAHIHDSVQVSHCSAENIYIYIIFLTVHKIFQIWTAIFLTVSYLNITYCVSAFGLNNTSPHNFSD